VNYRQATKELGGYRAQILELRGKMRAVQGAIEPEVVEDYVLRGAGGPVSLSTLFGDKEDLLVVHNMGSGCPYCTMWADGYNGVYPHLADRAAFVVASPDAPEVQARFAAKRGWIFPMVSHAGTSFAKDMGYAGADGGWLPGISAFRRRGDEIVRVSDTGCGPHDDFCSVWHFFDLLPGGAGDWRPRFAYGPR
jgi:predicted dithiol-disulfide oxidoreductase (DUF899 family)